MSVPETVQVGAVPPGHLTDAGHVITPAPGFASFRRTYWANVPLGTLENEKVVAAVIVAVKALDREGGIGDNLSRVDLVLPRLDLGVDAIEIGVELRAPRPLRGSRLGLGEAIHTCGRVRDGIPPS